MKFEELITYKQKQDAEKEAATLRAARNRARSLIMDAKARYIKDKTRARSKREAEEKDALINSPKYDRLKDYERFEDIQEAYGVDYITEAERDRLEELWEERERVKAKTTGGIYKDDVTEALNAASEFLDDFRQEEIDAADYIVKEFERQYKELRGGENGK